MTLTEVIITVVLGLVTNFVTFFITYKVTARLKDKKIKIMRDGFEILRVEETLRALRDLLALGEKFTAKTKKLKQAHEKLAASIAAVDTWTAYTSTEIRAHMSVTMRPPAEPRKLVKGLPQVTPHLQALKDELDGESDQSLQALIMDLEKRTTAAKTRIEHAKETMATTLDKFGLT